MWACKLGLICSLAITLRAQPVTGGQMCDPRQVWESMVRAKGGRDRLESVQTFYVEQSVTRWVPFRRQTAELLAFYRFPDFRWTWSDPGELDKFSISVTSLDLQRIAGRRIEGPKRTMAVQDYRPAMSAGLYTDIALFLLETKWVKPSLDKCVVEADGRLVLTAQIDNVEYRYHLPGGGGLPDVVQETATGLFTREHRLRAYTNVGGLTLPKHHWSRLGVLAPTEFTLRFEVNPSFDPAILTSEPSLAAGRDAWRPKKRQ
jgi:hypothetical protein